MGAGAPRAVLVLCFVRNKSKGPVCVPCARELSGLSRLGYVLSVLVCM